MSSQSCDQLFATSIAKMVSCKCNLLDRLILAERICNSSARLWSHGAMRQIKNSKVGTFLDAAAEPVCNFIADIHMGDAKPLHLFRGCLYCCCDLLDTLLSQTPSSLHADLPQTSAVLDAISNPLSCHIIQAIPDHVHLAECRGILNKAGDAFSAGLRHATVAQINRTEAGIALKYFCQCLCRLITDLRARQGHSLQSLLGLQGRRNSVKPLRREDTALQDDLLQAIIF
mmetsp:Transcript_45022/g.104252  ORF Transcript_45022/g.104252 Transcript_45022/m.104252 type:complete len:229 (+) Transcript_45022:1026-1712(+)